MDFLTTVLAFFVVLGPLVFVHELGHFLIAKLTGVHIEEFGLGFPPRLLRLWQERGQLWIGQTQVSIPSGFRLPADVGEGINVTLTARRRPDGTLQLRSIEAVDPDQPESQSVANAPGIDEVALRGEVARLERGTEYTLNIIPIGGFVRPKGEDDPTILGGLAAAPKRVRMAVLLGGATLNLVAAVALLTTGFMTGTPEIRQDRPTGVYVVSVQPGSPAEQAGVQAQDLILAVNGQSLKTVEALQQLVDAQVQNHPGEALALTVSRNEQPSTLSLVPRVNPPQGQGRMGVQIEQGYEQEIVRYGLFDALGRSATAVTGGVALFFRIPVMVIEGMLPLEAVRPVSAVGISQMGASAIRQSQDVGLLYPYLDLTAFVSIALAITNLLPIPALDGGRILFVLIEAIRGRRVAPERETMIHFVGMIMLLMLMVVLVIQDVVNPLNLGG